MSNNSSIIKLLNLNSISDDRGSLISLEKSKEIPFEVKRIYYLYDLKDNKPRGFHAHKNLEQVMIALHGSCDLILDDGKVRKSIKLDSPNIAVHVTKGLWREMHNFTSDAVILVIASEIYDENDYIRDYKRFLSFAK